MRVATTIEDLLIGDSRVMSDLRALIRQVARSSLPVLVRGPRGAGKELVAQALHRASERSGAFIAFNICAIPDPMFEDALFGHVRGAFTGAVSDAPGYLTEAHRGTVLLDEVTGVAPVNQRKLLRALETQRFRPVGGRTDRQSDFRLIAATNDDVATMISAGHFRADLADRLAGIVVDVPPLAKRMDDLPLLARHFVTAAQVRRLMHLSDDAVSELTRHHWPGNVRQLRSTIDRAIAVTEGPIIRRETILWALASSVTETVSPPDQIKSVFERRRLMTLLEDHDWNVARAAAALGVHETTVYRRMRRLDLDLPRETRWIARRPSDVANAGSTAAREESPT